MCFDLRRKVAGAVALVLSILIAAPAALAGPGDAAAPRAKQLAAERKLFPDRIGSGSQFEFMGRAIAVSGDTLVAGAPNDDTGAGDSGAAYVYVRQGQQWALQAELFGDPASQDFFGTSVAISGDRIAIGAPLRNAGNTPDSGRVYVFARSAGAWSRVATIENAEPRGGARFGQSVDITADRVLVGAVGAANAANVTTGAAYVYTIDPQHAVAFEGKLVGGDTVSGANFGASVSLRGTLALVGAPAGDGAAYTFRFTGTWGQLAKLVPPAPVAAGQFGSSVDFDLSSGSNYAVIGAIAANTAYTFAGSGDVLAFEAEIPVGGNANAVAVENRVVAIGSQTLTIVPNTSGGIVVWYLGSERMRLSLPLRGFSQLGAAVAVGPAAGFVLGGAPSLDGPNGPDGGGIGVFTGNVGSGYVNNATLFAPEGSLGDELGAAVSASAGSIIAGARFDDGEFGGDYGSAYVFARGPSGYARQARLVAADGQPGDQFGTAVLIAGDFAFVGAPNAGPPTINDAGYVYVFERADGAWYQRQQLNASDRAFVDRFGAAIAYDGTWLAIGAPNDDGPGGNDQGSVYVFQRSGGGFVERAKLVATDGLVDDRFGSALAIMGGQLFVGAPGDDDAGGNDMGSAYWFEPSNGAFVQRAKLVSPSTGADVAFGAALAFDGTRLYVGAPRDNLAFSNSGKVEVFVRGPAGFAFEDRVVPSASGADDLFGSAVAVANGRLVVGTPGFGNESGAVFVFARGATGLVEQQRFEPGDLVGFDRFGAALAIADDVVAVGAPLDERAETFEANSGAVYALSTSVEAFTREGDAARGATVGTAFAPLCARLTDTFGRPVPAASIGFSVASVSGATAALALPSVATGADGLACSVATANLVAGGPYVVTASYAGKPDVTWSLTNVPGAAAAVVVEGGSTPQSTIVGDAFAAPLALRVVDANGNGVPGVPVTFVAAQAGASATLTASSTGTDAAGRATTDAIANTIAGAHVVLAVTPVGTASFALANLPGATRTVSAVPGRATQATVVSTAFAPLALRIADSFGNPVPGVLVSYLVTPDAGGATATLSSATAVTGPDGVASVGATANAIAGGPYGVVASSAEGDATFSLENLAGAAMTLARVAGEGQAGVVPGTEVPVAPRVRVTDADGNGLANVAVAFRVDDGGGSIDGAVAQTDADGYAEVGAWRLGTLPNDTNVLVASVPGVGSVDFTLTSGDASRDLAVTVDNARTALTEGQTASWIVTVENLGPSAASTPAQALLATQVPGLDIANTSWVCIAAGGSCATPSGTGAPSLALTLEPGGVATLVVTARVAAPVGNATAGVVATLDGAFDPEAANDGAEDRDPVTPLVPPGDLMLRDGFEAP